MPGRPVVIAGGGTGGHLYPGLALADALAGRGIAVTFVGTAGGLEARVVPTTRYPLHLLPGRQVRGGGVGRAALGAAALVGAVAGARRLLATLRPGLVVGVGGYASVAAVVAARLGRLPTMLLEQNVIPGAANRWLGRIAARVCVGFAESSRWFPSGRAVHTGNPIRGDLVRRRTPRADGRTGVLVFGGSGGAHRVNEAALGAFEALGTQAARLAITHQTGRADADAVRTAYARLGLAARVDAFIDDMGGAYADADVAIARAGATSCAELTAVGLPAILVPYPFAADDHQRLNAEVLVRAGAAEMILDRDCTGARLASVLGPLLADGARLATMAARARALGRPEAAERVADVCVEVCAA